VLLHASKAGETVTSGSILRQTFAALDLEVNWVPDSDPQLRASPHRPTHSHTECAHASSMHVCVHETCMTPKGRRAVHAWTEREREIENERSQKEGQTWSHLVLGWMRQGATLAHAGQRDCRLC